MVPCDAPRFASKKLELLYLTSVKHQSMLL